MRLKSVHIQNFRCFEDLTLEFEKDLTVFVATNGGGKTTITDAIAAGFVPMVWAFSRVQVESLSIKDVRREAKGRSAEPLTIICTTGEGDDWVYKPNIVDAPDEDRPLSFAHGLQLGPTKQAESLRDQILTDRSAQVEVPVFAYYRSTRNLATAPKVSGRERQFPRLDVWTSALNAYASYDENIDWFHAKDVEELRLNRDRSPDHRVTSKDLDCVRRAVLAVLKPAEAVYFTATTPAKLALRWRDNGEPASERFVSQLSDGYRNMLALVMDFARRLAQANPQLDDPLAAEAILVVDEIDLHLHPRWQQTILADLRTAFPNTQIIVTTHSPQVLTTVESRCIRILENGQVHAAPPGSDGASSERLLERIMGVPPRPPGQPHAAQLRKLRDLIARQDLDAASRLLEELKQWSQGEEPALIEAELEIENRRWEATEPVAG